MFRIARPTIACLVVTILASYAHAAPLLNRGTSIQGAIAYQDDADPTQFHYLPLFSEAVLGDRLKTFRVSHFGVGKAFLVKHSDGSITSEAGAVVSGTVSVDISEDQRKKLLAQITKDFGVQNPKLLPLRLAKPKIESIVLDKIVGFGDTVQQSIPSSFQVGSEMAFSVGSLNSGFAQIVANAARSSNTVKVPPNPHIGMNILAEAEFVGDPWTAVIDCDLKQVWRQVRSSVGGSVSIGWFRIGSAQYSQISQDLQKSGACKFDMKEGSLSNETFGRQVMEMTKAMFEEINKDAVSGQGYFKFEPNPEAPSGGGGGGGGFSLFPWSVSINGSYGSAAFDQGRRWNTTVSYTGRGLYGVTLGTALAVSCNSETSAFFEDLRDSGEPCITQAKVDLFNNRTAAEVKAKAPLYAALNAKLPDLPMEKYVVLKAAIDKMVVTDTTFALTNVTLPGLAGARVVTAAAEASEKAEPVFMITATGRVAKTDLPATFLKLDALKTLKGVEYRVAPK